MLDFPFAPEAALVWRAKKPKGHWACYAEAANRCARVTLCFTSSLKEKIASKGALRSLQALKVAGDSAIEMAEAKPSPAT